jgi:two-component system, LytTR family, response regulator LytT
MKVLIIEDESNAIERLEKLLLQVEPGIEIAGKCDSIISAVNWFASNAMPDLIFMDIQLADGLSFEIFTRVKINTPIIFTSAYDEYAIKAFKVNSIDYLLKPLKKEELHTAIGKYKQLAVKASPVLDFEKLAGLMKTHDKKDSLQERFIVQFGQQLKVVETGEIAYFYTENKVIYLVTFGGNKYVFDTPLDKLESLLDPKLFFRINRQFIIHLRSISKMIAFTKARVKIILQPPCDIETISSTERSAEFKKWLAGEY